MPNEKKYIQSRSEMRITNKTQKMEQKQQKTLLKKVLLDAYRKSNHPKEKKIFQMLTL